MDQVTGSQACAGCGEPGGRASEGDRALSGWESLHHGADRPCMVGAAGQRSTTPIVSSCLMISARKQENIFGLFG